MKKCYVLVKSFYGDFDIKITENLFVSFDIRLLEGIKTKLYDNRTEKEIAEEIGFDIKICKFLE